MGPVPKQKGHAFIPPPSDYTPWDRRKGQGKGKDFGKGKKGKEGEKGKEKGKGRSASRGRGKSRGSTTQELTSGYTDTRLSSSQVPAASTSTPVSGGWGSDGWGTPWGDDWWSWSGSDGWDSSWGSGPSWSSSSWGYTGPMNRPRSRTPNPPRPSASAAIAPSQATWTPSMAPPTGTPPPHAGRPSISFMAASGPPLTAAQQAFAQVPQGKKAMPPTAKNTAPPKAPPGYKPAVFPKVAVENPHTPVSGGVEQSDTAASSSVMTPRTRDRSLSRGNKMRGSSEGPVAKKPRWVPKSVPTSDDPKSSSPTTESTPKAVPAGIDPSVSGVKSFQVDTESPWGKEFKHVPSSEHLAETLSMRGQQGCLACEWPGQE